MNIFKWARQILPKRFSTPSNRVVYKAKIKELPLTVVKVGMTVVTPYGIGTIRNYKLDDNQIKRVVIDLFRGYPKEFPISDLKQYAILHKDSGCILMLSSTEYRYIYGKNQEISYRVSNRNFVVLTDECKNENKLIYIYSKKKEGYAILNELKKGNIKLN